MPAAGAARAARPVRSAGAASRSLLRAGAGCGALGELDVVDLEVVAEPKAVHAVPGACGEEAEVEDVDDDDGAELGVIAPPAELPAVEAAPVEEHALEVEVLAVGLNLDVDLPARGVGGQDVEPGGLVVVEGGTRCRW